MQNALKSYFEQTKMPDETQDWIKGFLLPERSDGKDRPAKDNKNMRGVMFTLVSCGGIFQMSTDPWNSVY
jgi:hypothetical protein